MTFPAPIPLAEALAELRRRKLITTSLSSAELRTLGGEVLRQALFAARLTQLRPLQALLEGLTAMLEGAANLADAKLLLTTVYRAMGYDPEAGGFPQDPPGTVPEALRGTLRDLSSERRMILMITTHYRMAANAGFVARGMDEQRRHQWPAWELVRIGGRITPRGWVRRQGSLQPAPGEDWPSRWIAAGGELFDRGTRMMAAKDSPVWQALGDGAGGHQDTLGNPFPPFAFGSGMGIREVRREEALLLGVISPEDTIARLPVRLAEQLKADAAGLSPDLLRAFKRDLVKREDGSVRLQRILDADLAAAAASYRNRVTRLLDLLQNGRRIGPPADRSAAAKKGWETRRARGWTPKRMHSARADKLLKAGFVQTDSHGDQVKFGLRLKSYLDAKEDAAARKEHLAWAREAVRSGVVRGAHHGTGWKKTYLKIFADEGRQKGFVVVVDVQDGEAFNIHRRDARWVLKTLGNRQTGRQFPEPVPHAHATAGRMMDWKKNTGLHRLCKGLVAAMTS